MNTSSTSGARCTECATPLAPDSTPRRLTCSDPCRQARKRRRDRAELKRLRALFAEADRGVPSGVYAGT